MVFAPLFLLLILFSPLLQTSISHDLDTNAILKLWTATTEFGTTARISLIQNTATLRMSVQIEFDRMGCPLFEQITISNRSETSGSLRSRFGPDEMLLFIEGPSIQTLLLRQRDCNSYLNTFDVPIEGDYRMKVVYIRSNYSAVNELINLCPQAGFDTILDTQVRLTKSISSPSVKKCKGYWIHKTPELSLLQNKTMRLEPHAYMRNLPISSWLNLSSNPVTKVIENQLYSCVDDADHYDWKLPECADPQQVVLNGVQISDILRGQRIMVIGDSHARTLSVNLIKWACDAKFPDMRHQSTTHKVPANATRCAGLHLSFMHEAYCGIYSLPPLNTFDLVIANCGHHPAAAEHATLEEYTGMVTRLAEAAISRGYKKATFAWLESVPQPIRNDRWFIDYKDWRTYHRLDIFNQFAHQIMTRITNTTEESEKKGIDQQDKDQNILHGGFTVIPAFNNMLPFSEKLCDNGHYTCPQLYIPVYQSLVRLLTTKNGSLIEAARENMSKI